MLEKLKHFVFVCILLFGYFYSDISFANKTYKQEIGGGFSYANFGTGRGGWFYPSARYPRIQLKAQVKLLDSNKYPQNRHSTQEGVFEGQFGQFSVDLDDEDNYWAIAFSQLFEEVYGNEQAINNGLKADIVIQIEHIWIKSKPDKFEVNAEIKEAKTGNIIDEINFISTHAGKYKNHYFAMWIGNSILEASKNFEKHITLNSPKYLEIVKIQTVSDCAGDKDKFSEQYVDFKYQEYPSKCEKYTDGFNIMDSMVKLYKSCLDLDKGTGKRAQFKEQYYKMKKLKSQHCN